MGCTPRNEPASFSHQFIADRDEEFPGGRPKGRRDDVWVEEFLEPRVHALIARGQERVDVADQGLDQVCVALRLERCNTSSKESP